MTPGGPFIILQLLHHQTESDSTRYMLALIFFPIFSELLTNNEKNYEKYEHTMCIDLAGPHLLSLKISRRAS